MDIDDIYRPGSALDMPKRPPWNYNMSKEKLQSVEEKYFKVTFAFDRTYIRYNLYYMNPTPL